jgi:antitoxin FitA
MTGITIPNLEEAVEDALRIRAAAHSRTIEEEALDILRNALNLEPGLPANLAASIRARFALPGGVELPEPKREPMREPPDSSR